MKHATRIAAGLVFLTTLGVYMSNRARTDVGDTIPTRYLPLSILEEGDFDLDEIVDKYAVPGKQYYVPSSGTAYFLTVVGGSHYSVYPAGTALIVTPVYALAKAVGVEFTDRSLLYVEKSCAAFLAALTCALLFLALREFVPMWPALILTVAYAFGTSSWSVSSMALWQHTTSQLFSSLALLLLARGIRNDRYVPWAGLAVSLGVVCRPTNVVVAVVLSLYVLHRHRRRLLAYLLLAAPGAALMLWYNLAIFGNVFGGYRGCANWYGDPMGARQMFTQLAGVLISPSRGLFVYSPVLILAVAGAVLIYRKRRFDLLFYATLVPPAYALLVARWQMWFGGHTYGPRLLSDALPFLMLAMTPVVAPLMRRRVLAGCAACLLAWSVAAHGLGAFRYDGTWDSYPPVHERPERLWDWKRSQLAHTFRRGRLATMPPREDAYYVMHDGIIDFRSPDAGRFLRYGWGLLEPWGVWALAGESQLRIYAPDLPGRTMEIRARPFGFPRRKKPQVLAVYLDSHKLHTHRFGAAWEWETIVVDLPAELDTSRAHTLTFHFAHYRRLGQPGFGDPRFFSAGFETITFGKP